MISLVTGGAGFIGSHVARHCLHMGHEVIVLDDLSGGFSENVPAAAKFIAGSVTDTALVQDIFRRYRIDYVYHLAAYAAEGLSHFIRHFNYTNNLLGSINLINEAVRHEVKCFVFTSSIAVYGAGQVPMTEDQTPVPEDPYGVSKHAVELDLHSTSRMFGLDFVIFRPHNVYGENQNITDRYRNVIGIFMAQVMRGEPMTVFGDGLQTRAFSHIDDVAPYIARSVEVPAARNQVFNIGADQPTSVLRLAEIVARAFGAELRVDFLPARNEVLHAFADHSKARSILGAPGRVPLDHGIMRMAEWVKRRGIPPRGSSFGRIEISRNMPPSWRELAGESAK